MAEPEIPYVRDGIKMSHDDLQQHARALLRRSDRSQNDVAEELDLSRSVVAKAVTTPGDRYQKTQRRIVELLSDYWVEREKEVTFRYVKKEREETSTG